MNEEALTAADVPGGSGRSAVNPGAWSKAFAGTPAQVGAARRWVDGLLAGCPLAADAALLVSEVATNAVRHSASGHGVFGVAVEIADAQVTVTVTDEGGPTVPRPVPAHQRGEHGHGLALVGSLADAWGVDGNRAGRIVWFRMAWKPQIALIRRPTPA